MQESILLSDASQRPIEERVVNALGKQWHVEHFVCAKCEKPFYGHLHYEKNGLPYCETHYNELFGEVCFKCNHGIVGGEAVNALEKFWCDNHFTCFGCDTQLTLRSKFHEFDMKPLCRKCYEKMPLEMKKRLRRAELGQPNPPSTKSSKKSKDKDKDKE